jgi:hypothetical protein
VFLLQEFPARWIPINGYLSGKSEICVYEGVLQYGLGDVVDIVIRWYLEAFISDDVNIIRL